MIRYIFFTLVLQELVRLFNSFVGESPPPHKCHHPLVNVTKQSGLLSFKPKEERYLISSFVENAWNFILEMPFPY